MSIADHQSGQPQPAGSQISEHGAPTLRGFPIPDVTAKTTFCPSLSAASTTSNAAFSFSSQATGVGVARWSPLRHGQDPKH